MSKPNYRLNVPVNLCMSVPADTPEEAIAAAKRMLAGSPIEDGLSISRYDVGGDDRHNPDVRLYANEPFNGITVEDVEESDDA